MTKGAVLEQFAGESVVEIFDEALFVESADVCLFEKILEYANSFACLFSDCCLSICSIILSLVVFLEVLDAAVALLVIPFTFVVDVCVLLADTFVLEAFAFVLVVV